MELELRECSLTKNEKKERVKQLSSEHEALQKECEDVSITLTVYDLENMEL